MSSECCDSRQKKVGLLWFRIELYSTVSLASITVMPARGASTRVDIVSPK